VSEHEPIQEVLSKALRNLALATVALYLILAAAGAFAWIELNHRRDEIRQVAFSTNQALCALRTDLELRVANAEEFLAENPNGIPGISAATIEQSIQNQRSTIEALEDLDCG
jgi:hypothetical protein